MKQSTKAPGHVLAAVIGASVLAASITACGASNGQQGPEWLGVCVDPVTGFRVPDNDCGVGPDVWDYVDTYRYPTYIVPAYGYRMPRTVVVVHVPPAGSSYSHSVPRTGGSASSVRSGIAKSGGALGGSGTGSKTGGGGSSGITRGGLGVKGSSGAGSAPHISAGS